MNLFTEHMSNGFVRCTASADSITWCESGISSRLMRENAKFFSCEKNDYEIEYVWISKFVACAAVCLKSKAWKDEKPSARLTCVSDSKDKIAGGFIALLFVIRNKESCCVLLLSIDVFSILSHDKPLSLSWTAFRASFPLLHLLLFSSFSNFAWNKKESYTKEQIPPLYTLFIFLWFQSRDTLDSLDSLEV